MKAPKLKHLATSPASALYAILVWGDAQGVVAMTPLLVTLTFQTSNGDIIVGGLSGDGRTHVPRCSDSGTHQILVHGDHFTVVGETEVVWHEAYRRGEPLKGATRMVLDMSKFCRSLEERSPQTSEENQQCPTKSVT